MQCDEELVARLLRDDVRLSKNTIASFIDLGGQGKFDAVRFLFMTPCGVYLLVFNMFWMQSDEAACVQELKYWMTSIVAYTFDKDLRSMPPILIVGTFMDKVSDPAEHEEISETLRRALENNQGWDFCVQNDKAMGSRGSATTLNFFPVDNTRSGDDPSVQLIKTKLEELFAASDYVKQRVPLHWLKVSPLPLPSHHIYMYACMYVCAAALAQGQSPAPPLTSHRVNRAELIYA